MKIIKLLTLFILVSLQVGATGYSHNMFVAHKKLQAGKDRTTVGERQAAQKPVAVKVQPTISAKIEKSLSQQISDKFSKAVTLNQLTVEQGPSTLFVPGNEDEEEGSPSLITDFIKLLKGAVFAFIGSLAVR